MPLQSRAKTTVDAILEATAQLLIRGGYERLTTNHIAARAGVSIGSVYMYFGTKEAIVEALVDRQMELIRTRMASEMGATPNEPLASRVERTIQALVRINAE